jgi:hypothetical protein
MLTLEQFAEKSAGNHRRFDSFMWFARPESSDRWALVYTHSRDSGLLEKSNAAFIDRELEPFAEDAVVAESHSHFAVGYVDGFAIKVYDDNGSITPAFIRWYELNCRMEDYPLLDEDDYYQREVDATIDNILGELRSIEYTSADSETTDDIAYAVYRWLWDNDQGEVENRDDQGGYPSTEAIIGALIALGYDVIEE